MAMSVFSAYGRKLCSEAAAAEPIADCREGLESFKSGIHSRKKQENVNKGRLLKKHSSNASIN
jgi:hypothetical protein